MKNVFIHIGNGCVLKTKDIIGVFDTDTATVTKTTREFLADAQQRHKLETVSLDIPRAFVVAADKTYLSPLSAQAICRRAKKKKIF